MKDTLRTSEIWEFPGDPGVRTLLWLPGPEFLSLVWELRSCHQCVMPPNKTKLVSETHSRVQGCLLVGNIFIHRTMDSKIKPVHPERNQSWIFIGRTDAEAETPILWPPDAENWLIGKDSDAGKDWGQEKGPTDNEMVGWHHRHNR